MLCQVIISSVCDSPQFSPSKREQKFYVSCCFAVEAKFFRIVVTITNFILFQSKRTQPVKAKLFPVCKPVQIGSWLTEKLQLHLLKLTCTECKVTRCNLITERFTNLSNAKWNLLTGSSLYIFKVYKNTLCCLWSQINCIFRILSNSLECLEHQVELTNICKIMFSTSWTWDLFFLNELSHLFLRPCIHSAFQFNTVFCTVIFDNLIRTETLMTFFAIHQWIRKATQMSRRNPSLRVHQNCTVHTNIVWRFLNEFLPPCFFYIVFQFHTKISVIPCVCKSAVNLRTRVYKSSGFCQRYNFIH